MPRMNGREPTDSDWRKLKKETLLRIINLNKERIDVYAPKGMQKGLLEGITNATINGPGVQINMRGPSKLTDPEWEWDPEW